MDRIQKFKNMALEHVEAAKARRRDGDHVGSIAKLKAACKITAKVIELQNYGATSTTRKGLRENWAEQMLPKMYGLIADVEKPKVMN